MKNYLRNLAGQILTLAPEGITKVRFAKVLYFVHKGLVIGSGVGIKEMKFIRMPLGPVPIGFKDLSAYGDIVTTVRKGSLLYDMEIFSLDIKARGQFFNEEIARDISEIYKKIASLSTSELVGVSHKDPSWINHKNGDEYFIQEEDLKFNLPPGSSVKADPEIEEQKLQAKLVVGMLDEIIDESTLLEYPKGQ